MEEHKSESEGIADFNEEPVGDLQEVDYLEEECAGISVNEARDEAACPLFLERDQLVQSSNLSMMSSMSGNSGSFQEFN